jgi:DNA invertase Pin-like site-specific DNA recombinase
MKIYGYIRVSTKEQNNDRQHESLKQYALDNNIKYTTIFEDKCSGKDLKRTKYKSLKEVVKLGDIIIIKEFDRLGRNFMDAANELKSFFERGVKVVYPGYFLSQYR